MSTNELATTLAAEEQKLLACIHCGLCLEACPTYVVTGDENDGPRGRLYLMRAVGEGRLASTATTFERHIDRCLGCRACEAVCPAGVEYGELLEASRGELFRSIKPNGPIYGFLRFVLRHIWLQPGRLKISFRVARLVRDTGLSRFLIRTRLANLASPRLQFSLALLESSRPNRKTVDNSRKDGRAGKRANDETIFLFKGCVTEGLFARVNAATARVLEVNGFKSVAPEKQTCCGALHAHAGDLEGARQLARANIEAFADNDTSIITNAGGCGAMLLSYKHLLASDETWAEAASKFSARVKDVSQQLDLPEVVKGKPIAADKITYDASCHLIYGQRAVEEPLKLLGNVPALTLIPLAGAEKCCGGAGVYNLMERTMSQRILDEKLAAIEDTKAQVLLTGNPGCHMHIGAGALLKGQKLEVRHPIEILDESYRLAGYYKDAAG